MPNHNGMGKARQIAITEYIKRHGLKICWVAGTLGMDEALFRYHLKQGMNDPVLVRNFKALMKARAAALVDDLSEIPDELP